MSAGVLRLPPFLARTVSTAPMVMHLARVNAGDFVESEHPRDVIGRFTDKGGAAAGASHNPMGTDLQTLPDTMQEAGTIHTGTSRLTSHPHYLAAKKQADKGAALRLVSDFEKKIPWDKIKESGAQIVMPMDTMEAGSRNAIPYAAAYYISRKTGMAWMVPSVSEKSGSNTGVSLAERAKNKIEFSVPASVKGKKILLVDDVYTSGKTILAASDAVRKAGGEPVMVFALASGQAGRGIKPKPQNVQKLLAIFQTDAQGFAYEFGFQPDQLTDSVLRRLTDLNPAGRGLGESEQRRSRAAWIKEQLGAFAPVHGGSGQGGEGNGPVRPNSAPDSEPAAGGDFDAGFYDAPPPLVLRLNSAAPALQPSALQAFRTSLYGARVNAVLSGRRFTSSFIEPGLISYRDCGAGLELLRKETIERALSSIIGTALVIDHQDITPVNRAGLEKGVIEGAGYDQSTGWFSCNGTVRDDEAKALIQRGLGVSCAFDVTATGHGGKWHNINYDREITGLKFTHLAIVKNPRFEGATIRLNSKQQPQPNQTIKVMFNWLKKKKADDKGEAGQLDPSTEIRINETKGVTIGELVETYKRENGIADDSRENEVSPDSKIDVGNGKMVSLSDLVKTFARLNEKDGGEEKKDEKENGAGDDDDEEKSKENAASDGEPRDEKGEWTKGEKKGADEKKNRKTNSVFVRVPGHFERLANARENDAGGIFLKKPETPADKLARGTARYGNKK